MARFEAWCFPQDQLQTLLRTQDPFVSRQHHGELHFVCNECPRARSGRGFIHKVRPGDYRSFLDQLSEWKEKHKGHQIGLRVDEQILSAYQPNASVLESFQAVQTCTVTNLVSLASSATAGWGGAYIDNSANLYLDDSFVLKNPAVNTAPGSNKAIYLFTFAGNDSTDFTTNGAAANAGTEGTMTFPSIATPLPCVMPLLAVIPYNTQNVAFVGGPYFVARKNYGGVLPKYFGPAVINYTGMTLSGTLTLKHAGVYNTVA